MSIISVLAFQQVPQSLATVTDLSPPLHAPTKGVLDAPVTIIVFSDFQCSYCRALAPVLDRLLAQYPDDVRLVFKHRPSRRNREAWVAHEASVAANAEKRFWEFHDLVFANQELLMSINVTIATVRSCGYRRRPEGLHPLDQ